MKKLLISLLAIVGIAFAGPIYYNGTGAGGNIISVKRPYSVFLDVTVDTADVAYSQVIDLINLPLIDTANTKIGTLSGLCYDVSDMAAVTDSVLVTASVQFSRGAGDGSNANSNKSWAWTAVTGDSLALSGASQANASVTGTIANVVLGSANGDRYARIKVENTSKGSAAAAKNVSRCKYWLTGKAVN
jgi:hypothetical protein